MGRGDVLAPCDDEPEFEDISGIVREAGAERVFLRALRRRRRRGASVVVVTPPRRPKKEPAGHADHAEIARGELEQRLESGPYFSTADRSRSAQR